MIIITDSHITLSKGNHIPFFKMLKQIEKTDHDVIFLGDIFDLWISFSRYENEINAQFLKWCKIQKKKRVVGYIEGNHEFYLSEERGDYFSWCTKLFYNDDHGNFFVHGDKIDKTDKGYLFLRKFTKNKITKTIIRFLPFGLRIIESCKKKINKGTHAEKFLPVDEINNFADKIFKKNIRNIFVGHFHEEYLLKNNNGQKLYILPDWADTQKITLFNREKNTVKSIDWKNI